ncbi:MAG: hypothetical protein J6K46_08990 [Sutterella sp.]|nr:hypothetical protein [Sutterella sp.]
MNREPTVQSQSADTRSAAADGAETVPARHSALCRMALFFLQAQIGRFHFVMASLILWSLLPVLVLAVYWAKVRFLPSFGSATFAGISVYIGVGFLLLQWILGWALITVERLNDIHASRLWALLFLIPPLYLALWAVLCVQRGDTSIDRLKNLF